MSQVGPARIASKENIDAKSQDKEESKSEAEPYQAEAQVNLITDDKS